MFIDLGTINSNIIRSNNSERLQISQKTKVFPALERSNNQKDDNVRDNVTSLYVQKKYEITV